MSTKGKEFKLALEPATAVLEMLLDYYEIDKNDIEIEQGPEAMQTLFNGLIKAIRRGRLEISVESGDIKVVQHLRFPPGDVKEIVYGVVGQTARMAMDKIKSTAEQERMCAFMGSLADLPGGSLSKLKGVDMGTMNRLATVFSMV